MGSLCSPENANPADGSNTDKARKRSNKPNNEDSVASYEESDDLQIPSVGDMHSNTSRAGLKGVRQELGLSDDQKKDKSFQIVVSPPDGAEPGSFSSIQDGARPSDSDSMDEEGAMNKKERIDSTLGGKISWKKVADFSALLPREVKLKLWNGVFKNKTDYKQPEVKRISKVLRTFVMLQLTRDYKKTNTNVPNTLKTQLPSAVREPSKFIASFLKRNKSQIHETFSTIYDTLSEKFKTDDVTKKKKYAKKVQMTQDNYAQLTKESLKKEFDKEDFLKAAFLQYMLYAFQIKLETEGH